MIYYSFTSMMGLHLMMGIGIAAAYVLWMRYKQRPRRWFIFGGDILSFGDPQLWLKWYLVAYAFEFITSFHPSMGSVFYWEVAMSFVEAAVFTIGVFITDRIVSIFEIEPVRPFHGAPAVEVPYMSDLRTPSIIARWRASRAAKKSKATEATANRKRTFDNLTRGH